VSVAGKYLIVRGREAGNVRMHLFGHAYSIVTAPAAVTK
jgi:hypothetical protein